MPLTMARTGEAKTIVRVTGRDEVRNHLAKLGFIEGEQVTVVSEQGGDMILNIKGSRIALGRTMANRIMV